jgi:hypothetical protein
MDRSKRDIRRRARRVAERKPAVRITIKADELTRVYSRVKKITFGVRGIARWVPTRVMGTEVAKEQSIIGWEVQKERKVRTVTRRTGRDRRKIEIEDVKIRASEIDMYSQ